MSSMSRAMTRVVLGSAAAVALTACNADRLNVPNFNNPGTEAATRDARSAIGFQVGGILDAARAQQPGHISGVGIMGRESFNYTPQEGRNTSGYLIDPQNPTSFSAGVSFGARYANARNIFNLLAVADASPALSAAEKASVGGFGRTMRALEFHYVLATRDELGMPIEQSDDPSAIFPFVSRDSAFRAIKAELATARTNLSAAGATFPFTLTSGFAGFNTPATFAQFNQALTARVEVYHATAGCGAPCYTNALAAVAASFIDPTGDLAAGVYHVYGIAPESPNTINSTTNRDVLAHPSIRTDRAAGDTRYDAKIAPIAAPRAPGGGVAGITTDLGFIRYPAQTTPIPIIRNEELILLRAEARYFTGDVAGALTDINTIRTRAGGLAARGAFTSADDFTTELLYQRRYSLLLEGHRWIDVRRLGRLNSLPLDHPTHVRAANFVVPQGECQVRRNTGDNALFGPGCP